MTLALGWERVAPAPVTIVRPSPDELCDRYADRVYRFAALVGRDGLEAEDLAQDALEKAIRYLHTYDPARGELEGWLFRIVANAARDAGRVARRRTQLWERLVSARPSREAESMDIADSIADDSILAAVRGLKPRDRALIALRFGADLDYATVGSHMGLSAAAAQVATSRALALLKRRLELEERE